MYLRYVLARGMVHTNPKYVAPTDSYQGSSLQKRGIKHTILGEERENENGQWLSNFKRIPYVNELQQFNRCGRIRNRSTVHA